MKEIKIRSAEFLGTDSKIEYKNELIDVCRRIVEHLSGNEEKHDAKIKDLTADTIEAGTIKPPSNKPDAFQTLRKQAEEWREQQQKRHEEEMRELDNLIECIKFIKRQTSNPTEDKEADLEYFARLYLDGIIDMGYFKKQVFEIFEK